MRALLIVTLLAGTARADDDDTGPKNPALATWLSAGSTAAGYGILGTIAATGHWRSDGARIPFVIGGTLALVGPSFGHLYAQVPTSGGAYLRLAALPAGLVAMIVTNAECEELEPCPGHPIGTGILVTAGAMIVAGSIWDIATAGHAARRYNRSWHRAPVTLVPTLSDTQAGFAVAGSF